MLAGRERAVPENINDAIITGGNNNLLAVGVRAFLSFMKKVP